MDFIGYGYVAVFGLTAGTIWLVGRAIVNWIDRRIDKKVKERFYGEIDINKRKNGKH